MAHLLQARASMLRGKATGLDRVAPEMIMALPWEALRVSRQIFERRYMGLDPTSETLAEKNITIPLPTHAKQVTHLQGHLLTEHTGQVVMRMLGQLAFPPTV